MNKLFYSPQSASVIPNALSVVVWSVGKVTKSVGESDGLFAWSAGLLLLCTSSSSLILICRDLRFFLEPLSTSGVVDNRLFLPADFDFGVGVVVRWQTDFDSLDGFFLDDACFFVFFFFVGVTSTGISSSWSKSLSVLSSIVGGLVGSDGTIDGDRPGDNDDFFCRDSRSRFRCSDATSAALFVSHRQLQIQTDYYIQSRFATYFARLTLV